MSYYKFQINIAKIHESNIPLPKSITILSVHNLLIPSSPAIDTLLLGAKEIVDIVSDWALVQALIGRTMHKSIRSKRTLRSMNSEYSQVHNFSNAFLGYTGMFHWRIDSNTLQV